MNTSTRRSRSTAIITSARTKTYLPVFAKLVKKGGSLGIACPGLTRDVRRRYSRSIRTYWQADEDDFKNLSNRGMVEKLLAEQRPGRRFTRCAEVEDAREIWYELGKGRKRKI
jgi:hypothetical protein